MCAAVRLVWGLLLFCIASVVADDVVADYPSPLTLSSSSLPEAPCKKNELSIRSATPSFAFASTSNLITFRGCGFTPGPEETLFLRIGAMQCAIYSMSATTIACRTTPISVTTGYSSVSITISGGSSDRYVRKDEFFFWYQPKIHRAIPSSFDIRAAPLVRIEISGFYNANYSVEVQGIDVELVESHAGYLRIKLPQLLHLPTPLQAGVNIYTIGASLEPIRIASAPGLLSLTSGSENSMYITDMSPSWAIATRPAEWFSITIANLDITMDYDISFGGIAIGHVTLSREDLTLSADIPPCRTDTCLGVVDVVVVGNGSEIDTWEFTYQVAPFGGTNQIYPGVELPCNYNHDMRVTLRDFKYNVPVRLQLGNFAPTKENANLFVTNDGFTFTLPAAETPYATGPIALYDDALNEVFSGSLFYHSPPDAGMGITKVINKPMEIGYIAPLTLFGYGFSERNAKRFVFADVLTPEAAAERDGNPNVELKIHDRGLQHSSFVGTLSECEDSSLICKPGTFDMMVYDETDTLLGTIYSVLSLKFNDATGVAVSYRFTDESEDWRDVDLVIVASILLLKVSATPARFIRGHKMVDGVFELFIIPDAYSRKPLPDTLAQQLDMLVLVPTSELHREIPNLDTKIYERKTIFRCEDGVYRVSCELPPADVDRSTWIYVGISVAVIALVVGAAGVVLKKRAEKKRMRMIHEDQMLSPAYNEMIN